MPLTYQSQDVLHGHVISVKGRCFTEPDKTEFIGEAEMYLRSGDPNIIFDLEYMECLNSNGISAFVKILRVVKERGGKIVFVNVPANVKELLAIFKLNSIFNIENNLEDGINYLNA
jgi:anti-anti-sigma factor